MFRNFISILLAVFALNAFAAVDANQATRADLETVKGIGPGLSGKILDMVSGFEIIGDDDEVYGGCLAVCAYSAHELYRRKVDAGEDVA